MRRIPRKSYKEEGVALLDLARNAQRLFAMQEPREKRRLLNLVLSNGSWEDGKMRDTPANPLTFGSKTTALAAGDDAYNTEILAKK